MHSFQLAPLVLHLDVVAMFRLGLNSVELSLMEIQYSEKVDPIDVLLLSLYHNKINHFCHRLENGPTFASTIPQRAI
jgi:hypothetical protein